MVVSEHQPRRASLPSHSLRRNQAHSEEDVVWDELPQLVLLLLEDVHLLLQRTLLPLQGIQLSPLGLPVLLLTLPPRV